MAENSTNLGRVSLVPKGEYDPTVQYERLDLLQYNGSGYVALRTVQGVTPVDGEDYMLLSGQGATGPAGPAGPGVPTGGTAGQVLAKNTATDYDTHWIDPSEGGGGGIPDGMYTVRVQPNDANGGAVYGGGLVFAGVTTTIRANANVGYRFKNWQEGGDSVSESAEMSFVVSQNRDLQAMFKDFSWKKADISAPAPAGVLTWNQLIFANGIFVGVATVSSYFSNKTVVVYSTDGIDFYNAGVPVSNQDIYRVAYGGGRFVAISATSDTTTILYSDDGKNWLAAVSPISGPFYAVYHISNTFFAETMGKIIKSTDGINWTEMSVENARTKPYFCSGNGKSVGFGVNGATVYVTEDGETWSPVTLPKNESWHGVSFGNDFFFAVGNSGTALKSADGENWEVVEMQTAENLTGVSFGNGEFCVLTESRKSMFSKNLVDWTTIDIPVVNETTKLTTVAYGAGKFTSLGCDNSYNSSGAYINFD